MYSNWCVKDGEFPFQKMHVYFLVVPNDKNNSWEVMKFFSHSYKPLIFLRHYILLQNS